MAQPVVNINEVPFPKDLQLCNVLDQCVFSPSTRTISPQDATIPEHPNIQLNSRLEVERFLKAEFWAEALEKAAPKLWIMSTQSGASIRPLHKQLVKGRRVIITEDPKLHLTWIRDRIFIKPLPDYLVSYNFWELFVTGQPSHPPSLDDSVRRAMYGFIRTYAYLICHESDFLIAQQDTARLLPKDASWHKTCLLLAKVKEIDDRKVSARYHYGELRLSRLNFYAPILFGKFEYERLYGHVSDYFGSLFKPLLSIFALITVLLSCLQLFMAVEQVNSERWTALWDISRYFSVICLVITTLVPFLFACFWAFQTAKEWKFAIKDYRSKKPNNGA